MKSIRTILPPILVTLSLTLPLAAQDKLESLSRDFDARWRRERPEAESVATALRMPIRTVSPDGTVRELMRISNGRPLYHKTDNAISARTISTDKVYPGGVAGLNLTGANMILGEWDAGAARADHQEFDTRVISTEGSLNFHSTHVAGTMIASGVTPAARGMAYGAQLKEFDWNNDLSEMATEGGAGLSVSNHSYGLITGWDYNYFNDSKWAWFGSPSVSAVEDYRFGFYDAEAHDWDEISYNAPYYLIVKSAGNDRNEGPSGTVQHWVFDGAWTLVTVARNKDGNGGYDCLSASSVSKNPLVVGAVADIPGGYSTPSGVVMSSFSSWGPTDDGRIKPDIVANGVGLYSTLESATNAYGTLSGTSMATPSVTGSIGLLMQHQFNLHPADQLLASTMKALVIHTADEAGSAPGPDYAFGWGLMNTRKAADLMTLDSAEGPGSHIRVVDLSFGNAASIDIGSTGSEPLRATIAWLDPPGTPPASSLDPTDPMLVDDVDLRIVRMSDGEEFTPWVLNPASPSLAATTGDNTRDNVEQVVIDSPGQDQYAVRLRFKSTLSSVPLRVSLVVSGNTPMPGPSSTASVDSMTYTLLPGAMSSDSLMVYNNSGSTLNAVLAPGPADFWLDPAEDTLSIPPLDSQRIHYTVDGTLWSQWTVYPGQLILSRLDTGFTPLTVPVVVTVLGPKIGNSPAGFIFNLDSAEAGADSFVVRSTGFLPLEVVVRDTGGTFPPWIAVDADTLSLNPGDSAVVHLTINALDEPPGNYWTAIELASNDSSTGPVGLPVFAHIGTGVIDTVDVRDRWNIVSLPVEPATGVKTILFPTAATGAFGFDGGYYDEDTLRIGAGYWMKFIGAQSIPVIGDWFISNTVHLETGWNMVGSLYEAIAISAASTDPAGILTSEFFEYGDGYSIADSIRPGKGYWVQASQPGDLFLSTTPPPAASKAQAGFRSDGYNRLTVSDDAGGIQTLYFAGTAASPLNSGLPPKPPRGGFDARFSDESLFAALPAAGGGTVSKTVTVTSSGAVLRLRAAIRDDDATAYCIRDAAGRVTPLKDGTTLTIPAAADGETAIRLVAGSGNLPTEYALGQNFPNPFNPVTTVSFELPADGMVSIRLYNVLGNEVAIVTSQRFAAGRHTVEFNADQLPSGVYIYTMSAGTFSASRKMVLMR